MTASPISDSFAASPKSARARGVRGVTLERISTVMGALGLAFIVVVVVLAALHERQTMFREAQTRAENSAFFLADHAQRLFEVSDIALRSTTQAIGTTDWDALEESKALWNTLREQNGLLPYVDDIWLNDASGRLRLATFAFPTPASSAVDRPVFNRVMNAGEGLVIGERIVGALTKKPTFLVARRLANPDGTFRGMASATLDLSYFTTYWKRLNLRNGERIAVVRAEDGDVLASHGGADIDPESTGTLLHNIAAQPRAGVFEPARKTFGYYYRVGELPLYVTVEFTRASVMAAWRDWLLRLSPLAIAAFLALASIMALGRGQGRREAEAAAELAAARADLELANQSLERRVAERTAELQESNQEIQRFAYVVSHDLRAPLVNIMGFTSELERLKPMLFDPDADRSNTTLRGDFDEAIGFIGSSIEKMDRLIRAVLSMSREERRDFRAEPVDLTHLLRSIVDGVAHRVQTLGAAIVIEPLPNLSTDGIAVEQIFSNLIDNAVKYLRPGVPGEVKVTGLRVDDRVFVTVADNGRGIKAGDRERVFELFRRAGPQDQPGEGIGLAHVRALVKRLGGKITLDSAPVQGCIFIVELPDLSGASNRADRNE